MSGSFYSFPGDISEALIFVVQLTYNNPFSNFTWNQVTLCKVIFWGVKTNILNKLFFYSNSSFQRQRLSSYWTWNSCYPVWNSLFLVIIGHIYFVGYMICCIFLVFTLTKSKTCCCLVKNELFTWYLELMPVWTD